MKEYFKGVQTTLASKIYIKQIHAIIINVLKQLQMPVQYWPEAVGANQVAFLRSVCTCEWWNLLKKSVKVQRFE